MFDAFTDGMRKATQLTRAARLTEATAVIQRLLQAKATATVDAIGERPGIDAQGRPGAMRVAVVNDAFSQHIHGVRAPMPRSAALPGSAPRPPPASAVSGAARFLDRTFANHAGSRPYKLYVPAGYRAAAPAPLIIMLHGCTQNPDDFAAGTKMNRLADAANFLVAYPAQTPSANLQRCWNWFNAADQARDAGEPSLIAGITRQVMADYAVDTARVFVAGLSAGGAAAAIMGQAYPELYAAVGVHSGLACGAARDMPSAFAAMRQGASGHGAAISLPTIVFHGDQDRTVNPRNGAAIVSQFTGGAAGETRVENGRSAGGRCYIRTVHSNAAGKTIAEHWLVRGAAHAWSGGSPAGSYTDPPGPDASAEMLRFFIDVTTKETS